MMAREPINDEQTKGPAKPLFAEDDLTPRLVHDLKGPLSAVSMNVDFVLDQLPQDKKFDVIRAALQDCRHAGNRLFRMMADLLDVAKIEHNRLELNVTPVLLAGLLKTAADEFATEAEIRGVKLRIELAAGLDAVDADAEILLRVVQNLIESSLRQMRAGGNVVVAARQAGRSHVEILVGNDGPAMSKEDAAELFEKRPVTSSASGPSATSRISLYFCRHTIEAMGSTITLEKTSELATCFAIRLPTSSTSRI